MKMSLEIYTEKREIYYLFLKAKRWALFWITFDGSETETYNFHYSIVNIYRYLFLRHVFSQVRSFKTEFLENLFEKHRWISKKCYVDLLIFYIFVISIKSWVDLCQIRKFSRVYLFVEKSNPTVPHEINCVK